jgi:Ca-activated chloride channel family protein
MTPMTTRRTRLAIAGALLGATALAGVVAARRSPGGTGGPAHVSAPGAGPVTFTGTLDRTSVLRGGDGVVRMELVMRAAPEPNVTIARRPTDLVVVLDRSGSMTGEKIEHARAAVRELTSQLGESDRFALVTYANVAALPIALAPATAAARAAWLEVVASIVPDGGTNVSAGLDLAMDLVERSRGAGRAARAILISDGLANQGDDSTEGLVRRAGRAAHGEYVLSTVGVGADFNEYLMTALADAGTGNYYYLKAGADLGSVFAREFDAARTTVASALAVDVAPAEGVRVVDAGGYPLEQTGDGVRFRPGTLFAGQERRVWVTLATPHDVVGDHDLGRVTLAYADGGGRPTTLALDRLPRVACVGAEDDFYAGIDKEAWSRSVVVDSYNKMQEEVAREVKAGRRDAALGRLRRFKDEVGAMNSRVQAPAVAAQVLSAGRLEEDVAAAFEGADQAAKQNDLSKAKSAEALDSRRVGAKK